MNNIIYQMRHQNPNFRETTEAAAQSRNKTESSGSFFLVTGIMILAGIGFGAIAGATAGTMEMLEALCMSAYSVLEAMFMTLGFSN